MTLTPGRDSTFGSILADLLTDFTSDFLFVTGAFDCTDTGFAATLDEGLATADFATTVADFVGGFAAFTLVGAALPTGLLATFFATGWVDFATANLALLAATVGLFAGFFIAFAIGSTTNWVMLLKCGSCCTQEADLRIHFRLPPAQVY